MTGRGRFHPPEDREIAKIFDRACAKLSTLFPRDQVQRLPISYQELVRQEPVSTKYALGTIVVTSGGRLITYRVVWDVRTQQGKLTQQSASAW